MLAALAALLACAAASLLALSVASILRRAFERYEQRYVVKSIHELSDMFLFVEPNQVVLLNVAAMVALALAGYLLGGPVLSALAGGAGFFAPVAAVRFYRARRLRRFDEQLTEALQQLANALRAGLTLQQAIDQVGREFGPPLRQEFGLFTKEVKLGVTVEAALAEMAARVGSEDLELVVTSTIISRQLGGDLAAMFETIAATIRERFRLEGKIRALTSQGKMQGMIVGLLPLFVGLFMQGFRPDLMQPMFEHAFGYVLVGLIGVLEAAGFLLIRKIVAVDV